MPDFGKVRSVGKDKIKKNYFSNVMFAFKRSRAVQSSKRSENITVFQFSVV